MMLVKDVVAEIAEKAPNYLAPDSILRKITMVRDKLIRTAGSWQQQTDNVSTVYDLQAGISQYPLPAPPGNIEEIMVYDTAFRAPFVENGGDWRRAIPQKQFNQDAYGYLHPYYYYEAGYINIVPTPTYDAPYGIKIFHRPVLEPLTTADMNGPTGFDPNFDMVLVYGVLREITNGSMAQEMDAKYQDVLTDYKNANNGGETYVVKSRW